MRQVVLDTETTGLEVERGHRIIEIGCVELVNRRPSGRVFHHYLNPGRDIDAGAQEVHGISAAMLADKPRFAEVGDELMAFLDGAELVIHNAPFDVAFIEQELVLFGRATGRRSAGCARSAACSTRSRSRATCIPASATASMRCASATPSTIRTANTTARCSTRASWPTSTSR